MLLNLRLLFRWIGTSRRANIYLSNSDRVALSAMTGLEGESAVILFVIFSQLLKLYGAIRKSDHPFTYVLRRIRTFTLSSIF